MSTTCKSHGRDGHSTKASKKKLMEPKTNLKFLTRQTKNTSHPFQPPPQNAMERGGTKLIKASNKKAFVDIRPLFFVLHKLGCRRRTLGAEWRWLPHFFSDNNFYSGLFKTLICSGGLKVWHLVNLN